MGKASAVKMTTNRTIVSQPANVTSASQLLSADQRIEEIGDHQHRHDQAEEVGTAHVRDEEAERQRRAHTRSIPSTINSKIAKIAIPMTMATASMQTLLVLVRHGGVTNCARRITIS